MHQRVLPSLHCFGSVLLARDDLAHEFFGSAYPADLSDGDLVRVSITELKAGP